MEPCVDFKSSHFGLQIVTLSKEWQQDYLKTDHLKSIHQMKLIHSGALGEFAQVFSLMLFGDPLSKYKESKQLLKRLISDENHLSPLAITSLIFVKILSSKQSFLNPEKILPLFAQAISESQKKRHYRVELLIKHEYCQWVERHCNSEPELEKALFMQLQLIENFDCMDLVDFPNLEEVRYEHLQTYMNLLIKRFGTNKTIFPLEPFQIELMLIQAADDPTKDDMYRIYAEYHLCCLKQRIDWIETCNLTESYIELNNLLEKIRRIDPKHPLIDDIGLNMAIIQECNPTEMRQLLSQFVKTNPRQELLIKAYYLLGVNYLKHTEKINYLSASKCFNNLIVIAENLSLNSSFFIPLAHYFKGCTLVLGGDKLVQNKEEALSQLKIALESQCLGLEAMQKAKFLILMMTEWSQKTSTEIENPTTSVMRKILTRAVLVFAGENGREMRACYTDLHNTIFSQYDLLRHDLIKKFDSTVWRENLARHLLLRIHAADSLTDKREEEYKKILLDIYEFLAQRFTALSSLHHGTLTSLGDLKNDKSLNILFDKITKHEEDYRSLFDGRFLVNYVGHQIATVGEHRRQPDGILIAYVINVIIGKCMGNYKYRNLLRNLSFTLYDITTLFGLSNYDLSKIRSQKILISFANIANDSLFLFKKITAPLCNLQLPMYTFSCYNDLINLIDTKYEAQRVHLYLECARKLSEIYHFFNISPSNENTSSVKSILRGLIIFCFLYAFTFTKNINRKIEIGDEIMNFAPQTSLEYIDWIGDALKCQFDGNSDTSNNCTNMIMLLWYWTFQYALVSGDDRNAINLASQFKGGVPTEMLSAQFNSGGSFFSQSKNKKNIRFLLIEQDPQLKNHFLNAKETEWISGYYLDFPELEPKSCELDNKKQIISNKSRLISKKSLPIREEKVSVEPLTINSFSLCSEPKESLTAIAHREAKQALEREERKRLLKKERTKKVELVPDHKINDQVILAPMPLAIKSLTPNQMKIFQKFWVETSGAVIIPGYYDVKNYRDDVKVNRNEVIQLIEGLGGKYLKSGGKGVHQIGKLPSILNTTDKIVFGGDVTPLADLEIEKSSETVTVPKNPQILWYQVKQLRQKFINLGYTLDTVSERLGED